MERFKDGWRLRRPRNGATRANGLTSRVGWPLLLALVAIPAAADGPPAPLGLEWCLERAVRANPRIASMDARAEAAHSRVAPAGSLEDPRLSYEASNVPTGDFDFDSTPLSGHQLFLRQKLPVPGLLGQRRAAARAGADAEALLATDARLEVARRVEAAWSHLGFAQRAFAITDRNIGLLRQLNAIAEAKYRVGSGLQQDVLRAQVELTALLQEKLQREAALAASASRLAALLDLPATTVFPETAPLVDEAPVPELAPVLERIDETSPRLRSLRARIDGAERELRASELESLPDIDLGVGYRVRRNVSGDPVDGDDFVSAGFSIRLPIDRRKWRARIAERGAQVREAKAIYRSARNDLAADIHASHAHLIRADSEAALLATGLIPQALQSLDSSRTGYEVGRVDFLSVLDSQVRLLNARLRLVKARADRRSAFASLEAAVGEGIR